VLGVDLPWLDGLVPAKTAKRLPTVLTAAEVQAILAQLSRTRLLLVRLLYPAGLRLNESLRLKDIDLSSSRLLIRR
jgi:integrase